jgi:hypothetical protein
VEDASAIECYSLLDEWRSPFHLSGLDDGRVDLDQYYVISLNPFEVF